MNRPIAKPIGVLLGAILAATSAAPATGDGADIKTARELLLALEEADADLTRLQSSIRYIREQKLQGDMQVRDGTLYFRSIPDPDASGGERRAFAVYFHTLWVGRRQEEDPQMWIFNGEWLIEKRPAQKQYVARQVAPPGADFDPLRLGEGPLPIPIGQEAEEVLSRYDARLLEPLEDVELEEGARERLRGRAYQLLLQPRAERAEDAEFREIRLWYDRETLLPLMARAVKRGGDVATVLLTRTRVNPESFDRADVFDLAPPPPDAGWEVRIEEHRGE